MPTVCLFVYGDPSLGSTCKKVRPWSFRPAADCLCVGIYIYNYVCVCVLLPVLLSWRHSNYASCIFHKLASKSFRSNDS